jgi:hypothetical protein
MMMVRKLFFIMLLKTLSVTCLLLFTQVAAYANDSDNIYCVYEKKNFKGRSFCGKDSSSWLGRSWYGNIRSIEINESYALEVYPYWGYWGQAQRLSGNYANWSSRDRIGSLKVIPKEST